MDSTTKLHNELVKISELDSFGRSYEPTRSVYVIEVENLVSGSDWDYYIGMTGKSVEARFQEHLSGYKTWKRFNDGSCKPLRLDYSLFGVFPKFHTQEAAKHAEGVVARALKNAGYNVYSDMIDKE
jgi:hypothetical protein